MKSLFDTNTYNSVLNRVNSLEENTNPAWGEMTASQMLKHCQGPFEVALQKRTLNTNIGFFNKLIMKLYKPLLYNDKPWKHNLPTAKEFKITTQPEFNKEKERLIQLISEFHQKSTVKKWPDHPLFGYFTPEQWGQMQYKHLNHHLTQFRK